MAEDGRPKSHPPPAKHGKETLRTGLLIDGWKELTDSRSNSLTLLEAIIHCVQEVNPAVDPRQSVLDCCFGETVEPPLHPF